MKPERPKRKTHADERLIWVVTEGKLHLKLVPSWVTNADDFAGTLGDGRQWFAYDLP